MTSHSAPPAAGLFWRAISRPFVFFFLATALSWRAAPEPPHPSRPPAKEPSLVSPAPRQWRVSEFTFHGRLEYPHTPPPVRLSAVFHGPGGAQYRVPGFWDGGNTWRIRFTPDRPGRWSFETRAMEEAATVLEPLFESRVLRGGEAARRVDVSLRGQQRLRLLVDDGGDDTRYDHADWADARFMDSRGRITWLDSLKPESARQGFRKLGMGKNVFGGPLRIAGRKFKHGLGTHAASEIVYRLPADCVRFQAWIGVDAVVGRHGSVRFRVEGEARNTEHQGRRDPGLDGQHGGFTAEPAGGSNPLFLHGGILHVSPNHRFLTYTDGTPFYWLGDTWWFCPSDLMPIDGSSNPKIPSAYKWCIHKRQRQGFSVVQMAFLSRIRGMSAFADFGAAHRIVPEFWRTVDRYIAVANAAGILPVIGMGWAGRPLPLDEWKILWRYMVARYGACSVTWLICGEYNVRGTTDRKIAETLQLGAFIKAVDPWKRAMTIHPWYYRGDRRQAWKQPWYDFIMFQGGHGSPPPISVYLEAYRATPTRPVLEGECAYEGIHRFQAKDVRNRAWRAFMSGCFGYTYGSQGLWYPCQGPKDTRTREWGVPTPWWIALERPGAEQLGRMRRILETLPWWRLAPLPGAISRSIGESSPKTLRTVLNLTAVFRTAKSANHLWCKLQRHPWSAADLPEIALHPKSGSTPATLSWSPLALPAIPAGQALRLVFSTRIAPDANLHDPAHPSDGVTFLVRIDGRELLCEHCKSKSWKYHCLDLTPFAGQSVALTLATVAGENANWDHAEFRAPVILRTARVNAAPLKRVYTAPLSQPVLVKADGANLFLVYFPEQSPPIPPGLLLHRVVAGGRYNAVWCNPRDGSRTPAGNIRATSARTLRLPGPPDGLDWALVLRLTKKVEPPRQ